MKQLNSCERTLCRIVSSRALQLRHRKPGEAQGQRPATEPYLCYTLCPCWLAPARQKCLHSSSRLCLFPAHARVSGRNYARKFTVLHKNSYSYYTLEADKPTMQTPTANSCGGVFISASLLHFRRDLRMMHDHSHPEEGDLELCRAGSCRLVGWI